MGHAESRIEMDCLAGSHGCFLIVLKRKVPKRQPVAGKPIPGVEGAQAERALGPVDGALRVTRPTEDGTTNKVGECRGGTQGKRSLERLRSTGVVMLIHANNEPRKRQRRAVVLAIRDC